MAHLELFSNLGIQNISNKKPTIMIFTEGTILGPKNLFDHFSHASYIPIKNCVNILKSWEEQGAEILYFTSRKKLKEVNEIKEILIKYNFPRRYLYYRNRDEKYKDIIEEVVPRILIEDDCRSIGGKWQMCITYVKPEVKNKVKSIIVKEFQGIDTLPLSLSELLNYCN